MRRLDEGGEDSDWRKEEKLCGEVLKKKRKWKVEGKVRTKSKE